MKNSLVTGGLNGIGQAIAQQFHARGDKVHVFDIIAPCDQRVVSLIKQGMLYYQVDVSSLSSIQQGFCALFAVLQQQKGSSLDVLVNNAGITRDVLAVRMTESDWDSVIAVNLKGAFFCAQQALKKMLRQKKSYIINISSIVGLRGNPGQAAYAASKAGILGITKTLAFEYAKCNVLVNALAPGFITTTMTANIQQDYQEEIRKGIALGRFGKPEDVAHVAAFLTSGNADYITAQVIGVDGGRW